MCAIITVFELQFGASTVFLGEYSKLLDISKPNELFQFKICNFIMVVVMIWTRILHWFYLTYQLLRTFYRDESWVLLGVGGMMIVLFSGFNIFVCVIPVCQRFMKFLHKSAEHEALPADTPRLQRQQSLARLTDSAAEIMLDQSFVVEDRMAMLFDSLRERKPAPVRQSLPPRAMKNFTSMRSIRMMRRASVPPRAWKND